VINRRADSRGGDIAKLFEPLKRYRQEIGEIPMETNQPNKQKRLAERLGWTELEASDRVLYGYTPPDEHGNSDWDEVPDYFNDLNAAHELGEYFAGRGWKAADDYLCALAKQVGTWDKWALVQATASQRAEAALEVLLRTAEQKEED
jgi:hypothetical protein